MGISLSTIVYTVVKLQVLRQEYIYLLVDDTFEYNNIYGKSH